MDEALSPALTQKIDLFDSPETAAAFKALLARAPLLRQHLEQAVAEGHVAQISEHEDPNSGAAYQGSKRTMTLNPSRIRMATSLEVQNLRIAEIEHETAHALRNPQSGQMRQALAKQINRVLHSGQTAHDYTPAMHDFLADHRLNEAQANLAGFNALVDAVKQYNPQPTLADIYQSTNEGAYVKHFIDSEYSIDRYLYTPKPHYVFNDDLTITPTAANIEASAKHYFDRPGNEAQLGQSKTADYRNSDAAGLLKFICDKERDNPQHAGKIMVDMQAKQLDPKQIEQNGFDAGGEGKHCVIYDTREPDKPIYLRHTEGFSKEEILQLQRSDSPAHSRAPSQNEHGVMTAQTPNGEIHYKPTGNETFDKLFAASITGNEQTWRQAVQEVGESPFGQQFTAEIQERLQEYERQQAIERQQAQERLEQERQLALLQHSSPVRPR